MTKDERVIAEIDLDCLAHNMRQTRRHVSAKTAIMAVVKADAYGHGAVECARVFLANGADCLGVAVCQEGIALRQNGITAPIVILGHTPPGMFDSVLRHNLIQTIYSKDDALILSQNAAKLGREALIHIKVDTGMSRLGFPPEKRSAIDIKFIDRLPCIKIVAMFTHLAQSDTLDQTFTRQQAELFQQFTAMLTKEGVDIPLRHISNSGAIISSRELDLGMVRAGIILYGLFPSNQLNISSWDLKPALSWKTHVSFVRYLTENHSVSYGRTFFTQEQSVIATVPIGYADGFSRSLSNAGYVLIGGQLAPVAGTVCMDQFMVNVTHIDSVSVGDEVVIIGEQGRRRITANDIAPLRGTIGYEVLCNISARVPRVYKKGGKIIE